MPPVEELIEAGNAALRSDRFAEALSAYRSALQEAPGRAEIYCNIAHACHLLAEFETEIAMLEQALALEPGLVDAHTNLGVTLLLLGDFARGWQEYEWRLRSGAALEKGAYAYLAAAPAWEGEPLGERTLVVGRDQGMGDFIQMMRFLPRVKARGGKIVVEAVAPLASLLEGFPGVDDVRVVREVERPMKGAGAYVALMSLPRILGVDAATIPAAPYLRADPARLAYWKERVRSDAPLRIALVWAGNPGHADDRHRSCPFEDLAPLGAVEGVEFFSLQKGREETRSRGGSLAVTPLGPELRDFSDTAAVIELVDLTIGVDTAAVHLAGALGRPVWTLLPFVPDWRWMLDREDSPWYPSMRLFRQDRARAWRPVLERVAVALARGEASPRHPRLEERPTIPGDERC
jgi:hypothetical protein